MVSIVHKLIWLPATVSIFLPFVLEQNNELSGQIKRSQDVAAAVDATVLAPQLSYD